MTAKEFLGEQLADAHMQVNKVFEGISSDGWERRAVSVAMTPRQTLAHLCECCEAFLSEDPSSYEWGSFDYEDMNNDDLMSEYGELRSQVVAKVENAENDDVLKGASAYITMHEAYHVGQMATLRLTLDPEWNAYSIYGM